MKILLVLTISFMLSISILNAQKLNKTDILQDDIYLYPPNYLPPPAPADYLNRNFNRLRLRLTDIRSILRGDYNGDGFEELALIGDLNEFYQDEIHNLQISTLESRAYEIVNSRNDYGNPVLVNTQEGYSGMRMLDHPSNSTRNGSNTFSGQTPKNAIIDRHSSGITLNSNTFAVSGNFYPVSGAESNDEILLFRNTGSNVENVTMFAYNDPTPGYIMDYNFTESTVYNSNFPDFDIESQNWVAVLDMIGSDGRDEVYILKRTGTNQIFKSSPSERI